MRIIRRGVKPEEVNLYFICGHCQCEFTAEKRECEFKDDGRNGGGFVAACPDCGKNVVGTDIDTYMRRKLENL